MEKNRWKETQKKSEKHVHLVGRLSDLALQSPRKSTGNSWSQWLHQKNNLKFLPKLKNVGKPRIYVLPLEIYVQQLHLRFFLLAANPFGEGWCQSQNQDT